MGQEEGELTTEGAEFTERHFDIFAFSGFIGQSIGASASPLSPTKGAAMRLAIVFALAFATRACCIAQDVERLLAEADPVMQEHIASAYAAFSPQRFGPFGPELQRLDAVADKGELVKQLAIFAATPANELQPMVANVILNQLRISPTVAIRVLAPYLETEDRLLRAFVRDYFPRDDDDYRSYVLFMVSRGEELPAPFIKYIYERSPGEAMLVLQRGSVDVRAQLQAVRTKVEAGQQERELTQDEREGIRQVEKDSELKSRERREVMLAEHIVSNALWLNKNKFTLRFQAAMPEAMAELEKLANHKQWWGRLYVVYIMRQNPVLRQEDLLRKLAEDENEQVREAAKGEAPRPDGNAGDGRRAGPPVASREVNVRAVGATRMEVTWQASVGATSYAVQRRQPDTETEFTTIARNVAGTSYTDNGLVRHTLYEYRVVAEANP